MVRKAVVSMCLMGVILLLPPSVKEAHAVSADIIWVIDTSVSMGGDIGEVKTRIVQFNDAMINAGIDAHYALVKFGASNALLQDVTDFADFNRDGGPFKSLTAPNGNPESGSAATLLGLTSATFRSGAVKNFILVTDEDDDSDGQGNLGGPWPTVETLDGALGDAKALFNFIGVPGVNNTDDTYGVLADGNGGTAFNILDFRNNPDPFFENFIDTKVEEIKKSVVPEPLTMLAVAAGLSGLGGYIRKRRMA